MRGYLCGAMRGFPKLNFPRFFYIEQKLLELGYDVVNPARLDMEMDGLDPENPGDTQHKPLDHYMKRDLPAVESCDCIFLGPNWTVSEGACEREIPHAINEHKKILEWVNAKGTVRPRSKKWVEEKMQQTKPERDAHKARIVEEAAKTHHDSAGKPLVQDIPYSFVRAVGEVLRWAQSRGKYPRHNWRRGIEWSEFIGSALRHIQRWNDSEDEDNESNLSHLWHAATNIMFLIEYEARGIGTDDRWRYEKTQDRDTD